MCLRPINDIDFELIKNHITRIKYVHAVDSIQELKTIDLYKRSIIVHLRLEHETIRNIKNDNFTNSYVRNKIK